MVRWSTGDCRLCMKTHGSEINTINEDIDHARGIVFGNVIVEVFWELRGLGSGFALDESAHLVGLFVCSIQNLIISSMGFSHTLGPQVSYEGSEITCSYIQKMHMY